MESTTPTSGRSAGKSQDLFISLPWYDLPRTTKALDSYYRSLHRHLLSPQSAISSLSPILERTIPLDKQWRNPSLLLSQCCGGDLFTSEGSALIPIARPVFDHLDCDRGYYFSHIVANKKLPAKQRIAINGTSSYSGCIGLFKWLKTEGLLAREVVVSGSHQSSLNLLHRGEVDLVAIDANTWQQLELGNRGIIGMTEPAPSPPFVCHQRNISHKELLLHSLSSSLNDAGVITGFSSILASSHNDYSSMAAAMGIDVATPA